MPEKKNYSEGEIKHANQRRKNHQYSGKLTPKKIASGMNAATANAARLRRDAELLFKAKSFPSAAALAILAIEEAGKISILRRIAIARSQREASLMWKEYRTHTAKNRMWAFPELVAKGRRKLDEFQELFTQGAEYPQLLDQLKQISFYTDCLGKAHWSEPSLVVDKSLAKSLLEICAVLISEKSITPTEIELWIKHMGPAQSLSHADQKQSLVAWFSEMQEKGLAPSGENHMRKFVE